MSALSGVFGVLDNIRSVSVTVKKGLVRITGFPYDAFEKFMYKEYKTHVFLDKMVEHTFTREVIFQEFFVPEFVYLLNLAAEKRAINATRAASIIDALYANTWFGKSQREVKSIVDPENWKRDITPGIKPLPHQYEFVCDVYWQKKIQYSLNGYLLGLPMGTGKSKTSLFLASGLDKKHMVIICPLSTVRNVWLNELSEMFIKPLKIVTNYDDPSDVTYDTDALVFNYESIEKFTPAILKNFDAANTIVIVDESHSFKDIKAQRTQALLSLIHQFKCDDILLMSGTPIKALGVECIPIFAALDNYCTDEVISRLKDLNRMPIVMNELLRNRLGMMMYRRNREELLQLPEKHEEEIFIKIPDGDKYTLENVKKICNEYRKERTEYYREHYQEYEDTWNECLEIYEKTIVSLRQRMEYDQYIADVMFIRHYGVSEETKEVVARMKQFEIDRIYPVLTNEERKKFKSATVVVKYVNLKILGEILGNVLGHLREEMTSAMIGPEIIDLIDKAEKKTILFTSYTACIHKAEEVCKSAKLKPIAITGANSKNAKDIVDQFKKNESINPLIASIKAMSTGHTITCANTVVFLNVPFRSVDYEQASDRVYRIGQDSDVYIYKIFLDTGNEPNLSTRMNDIITWSKQQFDAIVGTDDDLDPKLVKEIRSAIYELGVSGFVKKTLDTITSAISKICKPFSGGKDVPIAAEEGYNMSDSHIEDYPGEPETGLVPDEPKEEPKLSDGHVEDYPGEPDTGLTPDAPKEEPEMRYRMSAEDLEVSLDDRKDLKKKIDTNCSKAYKAIKQIDDFSIPLYDKSFPDYLKDKTDEFLDGSGNEMAILSWDFGDAPDDHPLHSNEDFKEATKDAFRYLQKFINELDKSVKPDKKKFRWMADGSKDGVLYLVCADDSEFKNLDSSTNVLWANNDLKTSTFKMEGNDPDDYKGEENGLQPDAPDRPKGDVKHEKVITEKDIEGTDPEDPALEPEVAPGANQAATGRYDPTSELIPGMFRYMTRKMEEDTIQTIPVPTKEEGDATPEREIKDLDDKDPHDPEQVDIVIDIEQNRDENRQLALRDRRKKLLFYLEGVETYVRNYNRGYVGNEGFIANFATGVVNVIGHVVNLFNAGVINGWRNFKRGELTAYSDSNRATMTRLYYADYYVIADTKVDTPQGMEGTYMDALNSLCAYLTQLDMLERTIRMLKCVENIERDMHKQNPNFSSVVKDTHKSFTDSNLDKLFEDTTKYFTPKKNDGGNFGDLFVSMKDYENVIKKAIGEDDHLRQVSSVHSRLEDIQKVVGRIADEADLLSKPQIEDMAKIARAMAETFDNYGTVIADVLRVQHNLTEVTKTIRKKLGM